MAKGQTTGAKKETAFRTQKRSVFIERKSVVLKFLGWFPVVQRKINAPLTLGGGNRKGGKSSKGEKKKRGKRESKFVHFGVDPFFREVTLGEKNMGSL